VSTRVLRGQGPDRSEGWIRLKGINDFPEGGELTLPTTTGLSDFTEAAGLLRYDPAAIVGFIAGHPRRLFRRRLGRPWCRSVCFVSVGGFSIASAAGLANKEHVAQARARQCTELLASLGPAFHQGGSPSPHVPTSCRPVAR